MLTYEDGRKDGMYVFEKICRQKDVSMEIVGLLDKYAAGLLEVEEIAPYVLGCESIWSEYQDANIIFTLIQNMYQKELAIFDENHNVRG
ncbi:MAG: hypothetical protein LBS29_04440 [Endomicrobium sp.]|jgi:hypothetical protein|nr:hypothetical protein [Endomicrobium sp.]